MNARRVGHAALRDCGIDIGPDPSRVLLRFFVPGHEEVGPGDSRAGAVIDRVLALPHAEVVAGLDSLDTRFATRHRDLEASFECHADLATTRLGDTTMISPEHRRFLGAVFSHEYSIEGAALCNPSIVAHPDGDLDGARRFVVSVRGIGEGHRSSIGFRTGSLTADGEVSIDQPGPYLCSGSTTPGGNHRGVVHRKLHDLGDDHENAAYVLDELPEMFDDRQLADRLAALASDVATRRHTETTARHLDDIARSAYRVEFPDHCRIDERVLWPHSPAERHGMEDARFTEMHDPATPRYCATYTAYDGVAVHQHLITTDDFASFEVGPMAGDAARGKGLAFFPRRIDGRFVALSRADRETNALAVSDDLRCWDHSVPLQAPARAWEVVQLGNCGSPIETERGWLVLTHGVGPMRTYSIGALLLDIDEPSKVLATSPPLLTPRPDQQDGYVPNVVYTCGALAVGEHLVVPYGVGDQRIGVAVASIPELLDAMEYR